MATSDFGTGKSVFVLAVVVGCFAILWPKIFYPMMQAAFSMTMPKQIDETPIPPAKCSGMMFLRDLEKEPVFVQTCALLIDNEDDFWECVQTLKRISGGRNLTEREDNCRRGVVQLCGFDLAVLVNETATAEPNEAWRLKEEMTRGIITCQRRHFPKRIKHRSKFAHAGDAKTPPPSEHPDASKTEETHGSRPPHLHPGMMPARIREAMGEARPEQLFTRVEKDGRPFPHPSSRQPPKPQPKSGGAMSIIMPLYSLGMLIFFLYTIFKMAFKKNGEADKKPMVKDFHMDPEYRKLLFSEDYENDAAAESSSSSHSSADQSAKKMMNGQTTNAAVTNTMTVRESIENYGKDKEDYEIYRLRKRLEETEAAMSRIMKHMGIANDRMAAGVLSREPPAAAHPPKPSPIVGTVPPFTKPLLNNKEITEMERKRQSLGSPWVKCEDLSSSRNSHEGILLEEKTASACTSQQSSPDTESYELLNGLAATTPTEEIATELIEEEVEREWVAPVSASITFSSSSSFENIDNVRNISDNGDRSTINMPETEDLLMPESLERTADMESNTIGNEIDTESTAVPEAEEEDDEDAANAIGTNQEDPARTDDPATNDKETATESGHSEDAKDGNEVEDVREAAAAIGTTSAKMTGESSSQKQEEQRSSGHGNKRKKRHRHRASNRGNADVPNGIARNGQ